MKKNPQMPSARRILGMVVGIVIIGLGIALFKQSHLGNDSISALNLRLAELTGLPFSIENVLMNLFLFVPQVIDSLVRLFNNFSSYAESFSAFLENLA